MDDMAWFLYVPGAAILFLFWRKVRGLSFDEFLERSAANKKFKHDTQMAGRASIKNATS